jgi:hypothetical protein
LVSVTTTALLVVFTTWEPKLRLVFEREATGTAKGANFKTTPDALVF